MRSPICLSLLGLLFACLLPSVAATQSAALAGLQTAPTRVPERVELHLSSAVRPALPEARNGTPRELTPGPSFARERLPRPSRGMLIGAAVGGALAASYLAVVGESRSLLPGARERLLLVGAITLGAGVGLALQTGGEQPGR